MNFIHIIKRITKNYTTCALTKNMECSSSASSKSSGSESTASVLQLVILMSVHLPERILNRP